MGEDFLCKADLIVHAESTVADAAQISELLATIDDRDDAVGHVEYLETFPLIKSK